MRRKGCSFPKIVALLSLTGGLGLVAAGAAAAGSPAPGKVDYNFQVRPILADRCFVCHGPDERARKARLRLDRPESALDSGAIVPGKPEESALVERITADEQRRMPPLKSHLSLNKA